MAAPKYNIDVVNELKKHGAYKGFCTILNGALACLFCILSGHVAVGIVAGGVIILAGLFYYVLQSAYNAMPFFQIGSNNYSTTLEKPINTGLMIASWPIALGLTLIFTLLGHKLASLWVWVLVSFALSLLMQLPMWKENWKWAVDRVYGREKAEAESRAMENLREQIRAGKVCCGMCGKKIDTLYSVAIKDGRMAVLCANCLPWKPHGATELQGMTFYHLSA